jgi:hypothetical protein
MRQRVSWLVAALCVVGIAVSNAFARGGTDVFALTLESAVSDGVPGPGAGNIEAAGSVDVYQLTIARPTTVYAQSLGGSCNFVWSMTSPSSGTVFSNAFLCGNDPGTLALRTPGTYTITVKASNNLATGTYSFVLWSVSPPETFSIGLEEVVAPNAPGPGAGVIDEPGAVDEYTLVIPAPTSIYAQDVSGSCSLGWSLTAPSGAVVFNDVAMCGGDPGSIALTEVGTYTIRVQTVPGAGATGNYSFTIWSLNAPETFPIASKDLVSNGVPGPGAGNIEEPGAIDRYELSIAAPQSIYFDAITGNCAIQYSLTSPSGATVFANLAICGGDGGAIALAEVGTYVITVKGNEGTTGTYSIATWALNPPEVFDIALDEVVAPDAPAPGAGAIEEAGAIDVYAITILPPTTIYADSLGGSCALRWAMTAPSGAPVFDNLVVCGDAGQHTLTEAGTYLVTVSGVASVTGTYSFTLTEVNPPEVFDLALEETIAPRAQGPGSGTIESPGAIDDYRLELTAGQSIVPIALDGSCSLTWSLYAPSGAAVFENKVLCGDTVGLFVLPESGTYVCRVRGNGGQTGTYSAILHELDAPQTFPIAVGTTVTTDSPGPGAGILPEPFGIDRYTFDAVAGDVVCLVEFGGSCALDWTLTGPGGEVIVDDPSFCQSSPGKRTLPATGSYVIEVGGGIDDVGTYAFALEAGRASDLAPETGDCRVDAADLGILLGAWGTCDGCNADLNGDGAVDAADLAILLGEWG